MDNLYIGLTKKEVLDRVKNSQVNHIEDDLSRSKKEIILTHSITFFNILNVVLFLMLILVGSFKNTLFIFIIITNSVIGIYQELKAKRTLDALSLLTVSNARVIRDGTQQSIPVEELVLDDLILLKAGDQIPSDSKIIKGKLEVNEALLTGESDSILKESSDELYSGSFITSGEALCQIIHVGEDNYTHQITKEAKQYKKHNSELHNSLNSILKIVSFLIIPLGLLLFSKQYFLGSFTFKESIVSTVAAALGMIPEGLVLLTSVALTVSVLRLAKQKTLVQELYCIETLARVDTLCLDKTGTITEGKLSVEEVINISGEDIESIMGNLLFHLKDSNATALALKEHFKDNSTYSVHHTIPFSSDRKYSGVSFKDQGTYYIGALQFLFPNSIDTHISNQALRYAEEGYRVLVLAHSPSVIDNFDLPQDLEACSLIIISDVIREDVKETLRFFKTQGVECKVISGDDPITVSRIAAEAGIENAEKYIDASTLETREQILDAVERYSVFGRVSPQQKKEMVLCLKSLNKTVAMTGDGVNDVLAFKEADVSIAMADGSDVAKQSANVVLLDNNFDALPHIVNEGRRVINNITKSASMFLIKTVFSGFITILTILFGQAYPFEPIQLSLISACCVGIPSFLLTYESNFQKPEANFVKTVFRNAVPTALVISLGTTLIMNLGLHLNGSKDMLVTICVIFTAWNYMLALKDIYSPFAGYRKFVLYSTQALYFIALILGRETLGMAGLDYLSLVFLLFLLSMSPLFQDLALYLYNLGIKTARLLKRFKHRLIRDME